MRIFLTIWNIFVFFVILGASHRTCAESPYTPFFGAHNKVLVLSLGSPVNRRAFDLFLQKAPEENQQHTLYSLGYVFPGHLWGRLIRNRLEVNYFNHVKPEYRNVVGGWFPEVIFTAHPVYFTFGAGPEIKVRKTPVNGGYFFVVAGLGMGISIAPVSVELSLKHFSNFYTAVPNDGIDFVTLSVALAF
jgi:hypothetical protein